MPPTPEPVVYHVVEPVHERGESYLLYGPDYSRRVVYFRGKTAGDLERLLRESGAAWLYAAQVNPPKDPLIEELVRRGVLVSAGERLWRRSE